MVPFTQSFLFQRFICHCFALTIFSRSACPTVVFVVLKHCCLCQYPSRSNFWRRPYVVRNFAVSHRLQVVYKSIRCSQSVPAPVNREPHVPLPDAARHRDDSHAQPPVPRMRLVAPAHPGSRAHLGAIFADRQSAIPSCIRTVWSSW